MPSFTDNINSNFFEAYTNMLPKSSPKPIVVYVEAEEDIAFWRNILQHYEGNKFRFEIKLPSNAILQKGKSKALTRCNDVLDLVTGEVGPFLLICVDSDYDYLLCNLYQDVGKRAMAHKINHTPYIFQTYTYSIENLKCFSSSLHSVCVNTVLHDSRKIDFEQLLKVYSSIVYDLFLWNLLFYSKGEVDSFTLTTFCSTIKILQEPLINESGKTGLNDLQNRVIQKRDELTHNFPQYLKEMEEIAERMMHLGLNKENAYLFIQGHTLYDNVVLMFLKPVCKALKAEREAEIRTLIKNAANQNPEYNEEETRKNNMRAYQNLIGNVDEKLRIILSNNTAYQSCFLFEKIKADIDKYFQQLAV